MKTAYISAGAKRLPRYFRTLRECLMNGEIKISSSVLAKKLDITPSQVRADLNRYSGAGLQGYGDPFNRMPFPWKNINEELLSFYRRIGKIRRSEALYKSSELELICLNSERLIFKRIGRKYSAVTIINRAESACRIEFDQKAKLLFGGRLDGNSIEISGESGCIVKVPLSSVMKII